MTLIDVDRIREAANADSELRLAARLWTANIRLDAGPQVHLLAVHNGEMEEAAEDAAFSYDVRIAAPMESWDELLAPVPRAFYQDVYGASLRHDFTLEGEADAYYPALRRLVEIMREVAAGQTASGGK